jgi:hypothetical protein
LIERFFAPLSLSETLAPLPLLQGIAWIDQSAVSIVRLRGDLLAPRSEINIQRQTAKIVFGPVKIASLESVLCRRKPQVWKWRPAGSSSTRNTGIPNTGYFKPRAESRCIPRVLHISPKRKDANRFDAWLG